MNQAEVEAFVEKLPNVQREENYGYIFYFVGDEHLLSFVTIAQSDNEYDKVSNLDREGVFRVNIGLSKETFTSLFGDSLPENIDYSALDVFMPHPDYAQQHFICILNPSPENDEVLKQYITEAHAVATARQKRRQKL